MQGEEEEEVVFLLEKIRVTRRKKRWPSRGFHKLRACRAVFDLPQEKKSSRSSAPGPEEAAGSCMFVFNQPIPLRLPREGEGRVVAVTVAGLTGSGAAADLATFRLEVAGGSVGIPEETAVTELRPTEAGVATAVEMFYRLGRRMEEVPSTFVEVG